MVDLDPDHESFPPAKGESVPSVQHVEKSTFRATRTISDLHSNEQSSSSKMSQRLDYRLKYTMGGHAMSISSVKFSPDGLTLASAGAFRVVSSMMWPPFSKGLKESFRQTHKALECLHW
jgi:WD40 repeat protein